VKAAKLTVTCVTVIAAELRLLSVTGNVADLPVTTLPNASLDGLQTSGERAASAPGMPAPSRSVTIKV
jgi:hypothetical protein